MSLAEIPEAARPWSERIGVPQSFAPKTGAELDPGDLPGGAAYAELIDSLREFLDCLAGALPDEATSRVLTGQLEAWSGRLRSQGVPETEQAFGHRVDLPGRGQAMAPAFHVTTADRDHVSGTVTFGRFYIGGNEAVHGGAVTLLFDEVLGRLCDSAGRPPSRTASLTTNFRAVTPIDREVQVHAWVDRVEGRKIFLLGEIRDGETLCAHAEGLFVALLEGQD